MKQIILSIFFIFLANGLSAQDYLPFIEEGKRAETTWINSGINLSGAYRETMQGDTIIKGVVYKKVWGQGIIAAFSGTLIPPFSLGPRHLSRYIREDTINQIVYEYEETSGNEKNLYDFGMQVGDILVNSDNDTAYLGEILYISDTSNYTNYPYPDLCDTTLRRLYRFYSQDTNFNSWYGPIYYMIEGVGGNIGWFNEFYRPFETGSVLDCVVDGSGQCLLWGCYLITNTSNLDKEVFVKMFPNPVNDILNIEVPHELLESDFVLSNIVGEELVVSKILQLKTSLNISNLANGIYFISFLKDGNLINTQKIIIQH